MRLSNASLVASILLLLTGCGGSEAPSHSELAEGAPRGVLIFVAGDTGVDGPVADAIASLADDEPAAVTFDRHYVTSTDTTESLTGLLTGYPFAAAAGDDRPRPSLAELFSRMGYRTFALMEDGGFDASLARGFDTWSDGLDGGEIGPRLFDVLAQSDEPFVGMVFVRDVASAAATLDALRGSANYDSTVVVLTADHGPTTADGSAAERFREAAIHVPLVVKFAKGEKPETVPAHTGSITSGIDLLPSLLALAGRDISGVLPGSDILDGYSSGAAFVTHGDSWAFVQDNHKVVVDGEEAWVFDLAADDEDTRDLLTAAPDRAQGLLRLAVETREQISRAAEADVDAEADEETLEHLRSLGYVQ